MIEVIPAPTAIARAASSPPLHGRAPGIATIATHVAMTDTRIRATGLTCSRLNSPLGGFSGVAPSAVTRRSTRRSYQPGRRPCIAHPSTTR